MKRNPKPFFYGETDLVENDDLVFMIYLEDLESGYTEVDLADEIMFEAKEILESFLQIEGATGTEATLESAGLEAFLKVQNSVQIGSGESVNLHFLLKNHSKTPLHLLKWYTPLEGIAGDIFDIIRDGQPIPYLGILATRGNPSPESYVLLEPGESAYAEINLTSAYDFSQPGTYTIKFRAPRISHLARSEAEMARTLDELVPVYIPSNEISERMIGSLTGIGLPVLSNYR
jgi:hypothetical protein